MADVAVVIGSYESAELLGDCVESLRAQTLPPRELLVVDGASRDGSAAVARSLGATVIETSNLGLGHLYNVGARASSAPLVFVANPDIACDARCLELLASALEESTSRFAADPRQLDWEGRTVVHARTVFTRGSWRDPIPWLRVDGAVAAPTVVPTAYANAGGMLVRRDLLLELGGFDEGFFLEYEDLDLCWRAWSRGWESVYVPDAVMRHRVGGATPAASRGRRLTASHASILRFALKALPPRPAAAVVAGELLRLVRRPRGVAPAFLRTFRALPEIWRARRALRGSRELYEWLLEGQLRGGVPRA